MVAPDMMHALLMLAPTDMFAVEVEPIAPGMTNAAAPNATAAASSFFRRENIGCPLGFD